MVTTIQWTRLGLEGTKIGNAVAAVPVDTIPILEVFLTVEGEGLEIGTPRVLVRVGGCLVKCKGCDTPHSWAPDLKSIRDIKDVVAAVDDASSHGLLTRSVSITGGEPLHYPQQMLSLARQLRDGGYSLSLETSGMLISHDVFAEFDHVSLDIKTPSSGVFVSPDNIRAIKACVRTHRGAQLKAIVTDQADLDWLLDHFGTELRTGTTPIILTPAAGKGATAASIRAKVSLIMAWNRAYSIRVIPQIHVLLDMR